MAFLSNEADRVRSLNKDIKYKIKYRKSKINSKLVMLDMYETVG